LGFKPLFVSFPLTLYPTKIFGLFPPVYSGLARQSGIKGLNYQKAGFMRRLYDEI